MTENARDGLLKEFLYADDLVLISEMMKGLKERFLNWKSASDSKGLKVNLEKTKLMVFGSEDEAVRVIIDPWRICDKRVTINLVLRTKCDRWIMEGVLSLTLIYLGCFFLLTT